MLPKISHTEIAFFVAGWIFSGREAAITETAITEAAITKPATARIE